MKPLFVAAIIGMAAGAAVAMQSGTVSGFVADIYPTDSIRREALNLCALANPSFNRLDLAARDLCYQHAFPPPPSPQSLVAAGRAPNQVDLGQAASMGSSPRNDVRLVQQSDGAAR
jgi:hypothetical protein